MSQNESILKCLTWAATFAEGSRDADESLDNPVFNGWLDDCKNIIQSLTPEDEAEVHAKVNVMNAVVDFFTAETNQQWSERLQEISEERDLAVDALKQFVSAFDAELFELAIAKANAQAVIKKIESAGGNHEPQK
tara:strand:+ start:1125 stop:1529 length:405 start_codon:yes stop_codon:yes gene_type:complete